MKVLLTDNLYSAFFRLKEMSACLWLALIFRLINGKPGLAIGKYPSTFGQFDTNYIIFRNVEIFKNYFLQIKKYCER
jgi:hypothetical protein